MFGRTISLPMLSKPAEGSTPSGESKPGQSSPRGSSKFGRQESGFVEQTKFCAADGQESLERNVEWRKSQSITAEKRLREMEFQAVEDVVIDVRPTRAISLPPVVLHTPQARRLSREQASPSPFTEEEGERERLRTFSSDDARHRCPVAVVTPQPLLRRSTSATVRAPLTPSSCTATAVLLLRRSRKESSDSSFESCRSVNGLHGYLSSPSDELSPLSTARREEDELSESTSSGAGSYHIDEDRAVSESPVTLKLSELNLLAAASSDLGSHAQRLQLQLQGRQLAPLARLKSVPVASVAEGLASCSATANCTPRSPPFSPRELAPCGDSVGESSPDKKTAVRRKRSLS